MFNYLSIKLIILNENPPSIILYIYLYIFYLTKLCDLFYIIIPNIYFFHYFAKKITFENIV